MNTPPNARVPLLLVALMCLFFNDIKAQIEYSDVTVDLGVQQEYDGYLGGGVSFCDFNGDGRDDLSIATGQGEGLRFFVNNGLDGALADFIEITSPVDDTMEVKQINWVDIDNDGDQDLYLSVYEGPSRLFRNDGDLSMTEISASSGISDTLKALGASWGDYDNDGYLDVFVSVRDLTTNNRLYHNNGDETFTDVSVSSGIFDTTDFSFCSAFFDYDNDGDQDIFIANDKTFTKNKLYQNQNDGTFIDVGVSSGVGVYIDAMSATVGDVNQDGNMDLYVTNTTAGNYFFLNNGDGTFTNIADLNGTSYNRIGWGAQLYDADNDLDLDLYVSGINFPGGMILPSAMYENDGTGMFTDVLELAGMEADTLNAYTNAIGDYNNDGYADIIIGNGDWINGYDDGDPTIFFENNGGTNHWLKVELEGRISNRNGVGSMLKLSTGGNDLYNYTNLGEAYMGQNSSNEFFGLGTFTQADTLIVMWPSGHIDSLYDIASNQTILVIEGQTVPVNTTISFNTNYICPGDSATLSVGGVNDDCVWSTGEMLPAIDVAEGQYWAMVTNIFGFSALSDTINVILSDVDYAITSSDISCFGANDGTIDATLSGNGPFDVSWNSGETSESIAGLSGGWYTIQTTDYFGCMSQDSVYIDEPTAISFSSSHTVEMFGNDGTATIVASGGVPPYSVFWNDDNAQTTETVSNLSGGNYIVWIQDENNCLDSAHVFVNSTLGIEINALGNNFSLYPNPTNDEVTISALSEISEIHIMDLHGRIIESHTINALETTISLSPIVEGTYIVTLIDASGIQSSTPLVVKQ